MINFRNQKGAISFMVLVTVLFFITFATGLYISNANSEAVQAKASRRIKEIYERDVDNMDFVYESLMSGDIINLPPGWENTVSEIRKNVPIPKGFYYVGGDLNSGVIISDNELDKNKGDTHDVATALLGNQFVWVPVPNVSEMCEDMGDGNYRGILYDFQTDRNSTRKAYSSAEYREPDVITGVSGTTGTMYDGLATNFTAAGISTTTATQFYSQLQAEFNRMIASVKKYKGFYIARYETDNSVTSRQGKTAMVSQTWYEMYAKEKGLYKNSSSVVSGMIWGSQWDRTLRWMNEGITTGDYALTGTGKGNYSGTNGGDTWSVLAPTGGHVDFKVKNIYDMAGNVDEWTIEAYTTTSRVARGGYCLSAPGSTRFSISNIIHINYKF